jgi:hypothetical protein
MDRRSSRSRALFWAAAIIVLGMAGCGGSSHRTDPSVSRFVPIGSSVRAAPGGVAQSGAVVAEVGGVPIYESALDKRLAIEVQAEAPNERILPVPPTFTDCIARLAALAKSAAGAAPSTAQLKSRCSTLYQNLLRRVLDPLISGEWVLGEAATQRLEPTEQQVRRQLEQERDVPGSSEAKFHASLRQSGENLPDLLFNVKVALAGRWILNRIKAGVGPITTAVVARYYAEHKGTYYAPESRDLGLIRATTAVEAARAKHELLSGVSFASLAKRLGKQPFYTAEGLLAGLKPHVYKQKALNDAIFTAKPRTVAGPVRINLSSAVHLPNPADIQNINGYYVFEVYKITPAHHTALAQIRASLMQRLPDTLYRRAIAVFVKTWRARWAARTNCHAGFVIPKCRHFKPTPGERTEDAYTLT